jgi:hypothetical protein
MKMSFQKICFPIFHIAINIMLCQKHKLFHISQILKLPEISFYRQKNWHALQSHNFDRMKFAHVKNIKQEHVSMYIPTYSSICCRSFYGNFDCDYHLRENTFEAKSSQLAILGDPRFR